MRKDGAENHCGPCRTNVALMSLNVALMSLNVGRLHRYRDCEFQVFSKVAVSRAICASPPHAAG